MTMMWSPATTAMNAIVRKSSTPKAAMDQAQKEVQDRISKLRK
jgi:arabinogalactan oligomer/maltooligosaccharide transport system substrate-binding protein